MTEQEANKIFRTKYPGGTIVRRNNSSAGNKFFVTFKPEGKVYYYACATYQQLLARFGFEIVYKHNIIAVKDQIAFLQARLEDLAIGQHTNIFADALGISIDDQIAQCREELERCEVLLKHYEEECIIN